MEVEILSGAEHDVQEMCNVLFDISERKAKRWLEEVDRSPSCRRNLPPDGAFAVTLSAA